MNLPPPPSSGYYTQIGGRAVHEPPTEATRERPGFKWLVVAPALIVVSLVAGLAIFAPRSPSPDEWATQLAQAIVVDGTTYLDEVGGEEARTRILAAIADWGEDSGCRLAGGQGIRNESRSEVRAEMLRAEAEARASLPDEGSYGVGSAIADRGADFGAAVVVADCTKEQAPAVGPLGQ